MKCTKFFDHLFVIIKLDRFPCMDLHEIFRYDRRKSIFCIAKEIKQIGATKKSYSAANFLSIINPHPVGFVSALLSMSSR